MDDLLDLVDAALVVLRSRAGGRAVAGLAPGDLMAVNDAFGALKRAVDAAYLPVAHEIGRQSRRELGRDGLARTQGFRTPGMLISATTGASVGDAIRAVAVGDATAPRMTLTGETLPAKRPHVAAAVNAGKIGMPAASAIIRMLERVELRADAGSVEAMEERLVEAAPGLTPDQMQKLILRAEAYLDPDGIEPREQELWDARYLIVREDRSGAIVVDGRFDPETGAPIKAALEDIVGGMLARRDTAPRSDDGAGGCAAGDADACDQAGAPGCGDSDAEGHDETGRPRDDALADPRSVKQLYADALADLCRHALGCDKAPTAPSTTVIVRMNLTDLEAGVGAGTIDGITMPVSAGTVRRMAADAQLIPCVLGSESEILDWGRAKRLFTTAQKLAILERDGGCACCGLPPSMTVVHHLNWWARDGGRTDLGNAIALCVACHHRVHDDGWGIRIHGTGTQARVWFIPPPWLDHSQTPRLGGRARFQLAT